MADNKEKLMKFVSWVRETKMPEASPEEVVQQIQQMSQDPQGQQELQMWSQEFEEQDAGSQMFKKGGKLDQLVEKRKIAKARDGIKTSVEDKAPETKKTRVVQETIYDDTNSFPLKDVTKTFTISDTDGQRDSTMRRLTTGSWANVTGDDILKDYRTYYTPTGAKKTWDNYNWLQKLIFGKPRVMSPEDMEYFKGM